MGDGAEAELQIKFRHVLGDVGPFAFQDSASIQSVKETIYTRWPSGLHGHRCSSKHTSSDLQLTVRLDAL